MAGDSSAPASSMGCTTTRRTPKVINLRSAMHPIFFNRDHHRDAHCLAKNITEERITRTGDAAPNQIGVGDGGIAQHERAATGYGSDRGALPVGRAEGQRVCIGAPDWPRSSLRFHRVRMSIGVIEPMPVHRQATKALGQYIEGF